MSQLLSRTARSRQLQVLTRPTGLSPTCPRFSCSLNGRPPVLVSLTAANHKGMIKLRRTYFTGSPEPKTKSPEGDAAGETSHTQPSILRPCLFVLVVSIGAYIGAAVVARRDAEEYFQWISDGPMISDSRSIRRAFEAEKLRQRLARLRDFNIPQGLQRTFVRVSEWWNTKDSAEKATIILISMNSMVFLAWRLPAPAIQKLMREKFTHWALSGRSYTLLTSIFSHHVRALLVPSDLPAAGH